MRVLALAVALALSLSITDMADAASLRISPIGIDMAPGQRAAALTLTNTDAQPVSIQVRVYRWSQTDGRDQLEPTSDLIVSPPVATIPAGASYTVRIARLTVGAVAHERSYRLMIDEIPRPRDPNHPGQGVSMVLRTSMPIFIGNRETPSKLVWTLWQDAAGLHAEVVNNGERHARISGLNLAGGDGRTASFGPGLNGYVLAGATQRFDIKAGAGKPLAEFSGGPVTLSAQNGDQGIRETLAVGAR